VSERKRVEQMTTRSEELSSAPCDLTLVLSAVRCEVRVCGVVKRSRWTQRRHWALLMAIWWRAS